MEAGKAPEDFLRGLLFGAGIRTVLLSGIHPGRS